MAPNMQVMNAIDDFLVWFKEHGGWIHPNVVFDYNEARGISLRSLPSKDASADVFTVGKPVITCPFNLSLSSLNTIGLVSEPYNDVALPDKLLKHGSPRLLGAAFLCVQYLLGTKSFWKPYLDVLPQPRRSKSDRGFSEVDCPLYWSPEELTWLQDTNIQRGIFELNDSWETIWRQWSKTLIEWTSSIGLPGMDWDLFKWALTIFGTRSFSPSSIKHWQDRKTSQTYLHSHNPHSLLFPGIDLLNHHPRTANRWSGNSTNFSIVLNDKVNPDEEICNTYGCQNNAQLLLSWGFCLKDNPYDSYALKLLADTHIPFLRAIDQAHERSKQAEISSSSGDSGRQEAVRKLPTARSSVKNEAIAAVLPLAEPTDFMAFDEEQGLFMVRDPVDVGDDEEYPSGEDHLLLHLRGMPEMLLSRLAAQVANGREKEQIKKSPESFSSTSLYTQLGSRNLLQLGELLREKLDLTRQSLTLSASDHDAQVKSLERLPAVSKGRLQQAYIYRDGQVHLLYTNARLLYQRIEDARSVPRDGSSSTPQLIDLRFLLEHFRTRAPNEYADFILGFGELAEDIASCVATIAEQGSEDIFTIATVAIMKKLADRAIIEDLGIIPQVLDWYIAQDSSTFHEFADLVVDVQQYSASMQEAFPESQIWHDRLWHDQPFLVACAAFVMEEAVTLAPHDSGPQLLCTGPSMMNGV